MTENKNFNFTTTGLGDIRRVVNATSKDLQRLEDLQNQAMRSSGKRAENARNLINQQYLQVKQKRLNILDISERLELTRIGPTRERVQLQRRLEREHLGIQRIAAKGETVAGQAGIGGRLGGRAIGAGARAALGGTALGQAGAAFAAGGPLIGGAVLAGMALKKLAETAKSASDSFIRYETERIDVARSITGNQQNVETFFDSYQKNIGLKMRRFGFSETQGLQSAEQILRAGGMRGGTAGAQEAGLRQDVLGGARLTRFFGMRMGEGAGLMGRARGAGMTGDDLGGFLGGIGERARATAPALRGRTGEFLGQALDYLKNISTTLSKTEKRGALNFFTRVMTDLAKKGAEFTGASMRQTFQSVDKVLQSGQGIVGGMYGRFLTQRVMSQPGATQIDVLKELDKGLASGGGKVFQDMIKEMKASSGSLDHLAVILSGETKRNFTQTRAFLEIVEKLDLTNEGDIARFKKEVAAFDPKTEADQIRTARAAQADVMLRFGNSVEIFRKATIALGLIAELILKYIPIEKMKKGMDIATDIAFGAFMPPPLRFLKDFISNRESEPSSQNFAPGAGLGKGSKTFHGLPETNNILELLEQLMNLKVGETPQKAIIHIKDSTGAISGTFEGSQEITKHVKN